MTAAAAGNPPAAVVGFNWHAILPYVAGGVVAWYLLPKPVKFLAGAGALYLFWRHQAPIAATTAKAIGAAAAPSAAMPPGASPAPVAPPSPDVSALVNGIAQTLIGE